MFRYTFKTIHFDLSLDSYYIPFIHLYWEALVALMVSTSTSTLMRRNSALRLEAPLFLIG